MSGLTKALILIGVSGAVGGGYLAYKHFTENEGGDPGPAPGNGNDKNCDKCDENHIPCVSIDTVEITEAQSTFRQISVSYRNLKCITEAMDIIMTVKKVGGAQVDNQFRKMILGPKEAKGFEWNLILPGSGNYQAEFFAWRENTGFSLTGNSSKKITFQV